MKFIYFIILFSASIAAESIFDNCDDAATKDQLKQISSMGKGYNLSELLFDAYCSSDKKDPNSPAIFDELVKGLHLNSLISESDQYIFFNWFLSLYPQILFNLQENNSIEDLVDLFIASMEQIEAESIRLGLEEYYSQSINILSMYVRNHMLDPVISLELSNYAERVIFNAGKENYILEGDSLPVLVHLKLNKISSLLIISEFDELLSEINLFLKIITTEMFANEFESTLVTDLLMDLNNPESRLENSNSIINLRVTLFDLFIRNKDLAFNEDFLLQLLLFIFSEGISDQNSFCNKSSFLNFFQR